MIGVAVTTTPARETGPSAVARPAPTAPAARPFRRDLQGLRAVAVLLVVAQHAGLPGVTGGSVGVDVFFVLSGFLITAQLLGELERTGRVSLHRFYARRMTRLVPAATVVVLGTLAAAWHWMPALQRAGHPGAQPEPAPLQHLWSLAVAGQFYLLWPVLLLIASMAWANRGRPSARVACVVLAMLCAASLTLCVTLTTTDQPWASFGIHTRAWEFGAGALVALGARKAARLAPALATTMTWTGLAAIVGAAPAATEATVFPGYAAVLPVAGAVLVVAGGCGAPRWGAERLLRHQVFQEIGRVSYGWYLWHWPVLVLAPYALGHQPGVPGRVALVLAALVPASMSLATVEDPIRCHRVFRGGTGAGLMLGTGLTACAAGVALLLLQASAPIPRAATDGAAPVVQHTPGRPSAGGRP
ncbi:acyltransferase family protein [Actinoplanes sp. NPDC049599]|uniref:acyltransferase family protein n=1 Tax=Actinoplanes sp. NPDC049599 TaxID=3363903 RepID=UPI00378A2BF0